MANISDDFQTRWWALEEKLMNKFGKKPDVEAILFLIGLQETGFIQEETSGRVKVARVEFMEHAKNTAIYEG